MADHKTRDDIDFISGEFWGRNPHDEFTWMRANAPVYWDGRTWGIAKYADLKAISKAFRNLGASDTEAATHARKLLADIHARSQD